MNVADLLARYWKEARPADFTITTLAGEQQTLTGFCGRVVGVDFYDGAWCLTHLPTSTTIIGHRGFVEPDAAFAAAGMLDKVLPDQADAPRTAYRPAVDQLNSWLADYNSTLRFRLEE